MTPQEAKEWAIKKWQYIIDNYGKEYGLCEKYPELKQFPSECSYCKLFWENHGKCEGCPINIDGITCYSTKHPWRIWHANQSSENAQKVLDLIINTPVK